MPLEAPPATLASLPTERDRAIQLLQAAYAGGSISVEEMEQRMEQVHGASTLGEVRRAVAELVPLTPVATTSRVPAHEVPGQGVVISLMGGTEKRGAWQVPRRGFVWTMMGGTELDYREALFGPGLHEVFLFTMWGGVEIVVPPTIHVLVEGVGIMGGFGGESAQGSGPDAPTLRIVGVALMGGVDVDVRLPGESAREARRRRKRAAAEAIAAKVREALGPGE